MATAFTLAGLLFWDAVRVEYILLLSFVAGLGQAFGGPAYQALIPSLVEKKDLPNAIALNSIQFNLARVIGPLLAFLPVFAKDVFGGDINRFSHMMAFSGAGAVCGALVVAWLGRFRHMGWTLLIILAL